MSTETVEQIHVRLREEIDRLRMSLAAAARAAGESGPQRIKDVVSGKQRCPSELLARLHGTGVDVLYVLTGERADALPTGLSAEEQLLLESYRALSVADRKALLAQLLTGAAAKPSARSAAGGVAVSGNKNRTAGGVYIEKK